MKRCCWMSWFFLCWAFSIWVLYIGLFTFHNYWMLFFIICHLTDVCMCVSISPEGLNWIGCCLCRIRTKADINSWSVKWWCFSFPLKWVAIWICACSSKRSWVERKLPSSPIIAQESVLVGASLNAADSLEQKCNCCELQSECSWCS